MIVFEPPSATRRAARLQILDFDVGRANKIDDEHELAVEFAQRHFRTRTKPHVGAAAALLGRGAEVDEGGSLTLTEEHSGAGAGGAVKDAHASVEGESSSNPCSIPTGHVSSIPTDTTTTFEAEYYEDPLVVKFQLWRLGKGLFRRRVLLGETSYCCPATFVAGSATSRDVVCPRLHLSRTRKSKRQKFQELMGGRKVGVDQGAPDSPSSPLPSCGSILVRIEYGIDVVTAARRKEAFWSEIRHRFSDEKRFFHRNFLFLDELEGGGEGHLEDGSCTASKDSETRGRRVDSQVGFLRPGLLLDDTLDDIMDDDIGSFRPGLRVRHPTEGAGTVLDLDADAAEATRIFVRFDHSPACADRRHVLDTRGVPREELSAICSYNLGESDYGEQHADQRLENPNYNVQLQVVSANNRNAERGREQHRTMQQEMILVGSFVRVKVAHPCRGWGKVTPSCVGLVAKLEGTKAICIFPSQKHCQWTGTVDELEVVRPKPQTLVVLRAEGPFSSGEEVFVLRQERDILEEDTEAEAGEKRHGAAEASAPQRESTLSSTTTIPDPSAYRTIADDTAVPTSFDTTSTPSSSSSTGPMPAQRQQATPDTFFPPPRAGAGSFVDLHGRAGRRRDIFGEHHSSSRVGVGGYNGEQEDYEGQVQPRFSAPEPSWSTRESTTAQHLDNRGRPHRGPPGGPPGREPPPRSSFRLRVRRAFRKRLRRANCLRGEPTSPTLPAIHENFHEDNGLIEGAGGFSVFDARSSAATTLRNTTSSSATDSVAGRTTTRTTRGQEEGPIFCGIGEQGTTQESRGTSRRQGHQEAGSSSSTLTEPANTEGEQRTKPLGRLNYQCMNKHGASWWIYADLEGDVFKTKADESLEDELFSDDSGDEGGCTAGTNVGSGTRHAHDRSITSCASAHPLKLLLTNRSAWLDQVVLHQQDDQRESPTSRGEDEDENLSSSTSSSRGEEDENLSSSTASPAPLSLSRAVRGVMRTFALPRSQRPLLRKRLREKWNFPLTKEEALDLGVLKPGDHALLVGMGTSGGASATSNEVDTTSTTNSIVEVVSVLGRCIDQQETTSSKDTTCGVSSKEVGEDKRERETTQTVVYYIVENKTGDVSTVPRDRLIALCGAIDSGNVAAYNTTSESREEQVENSQENHLQHDLIVVNAGGKGERCNGNYGRKPVRSFRGRPVYKNERGAIIYWAGFWKMNYFDDTGSWYFAVRDSRKLMEPPLTTSFSASFDDADYVTPAQSVSWSNYGYTGGKARPCPIVTRSGRLPSGVRLLGESEEMRAPPAPGKRIVVLPSAKNRLEEGQDHLHALEILEVVAAHSHSSLPKSPTTDQSCALLVRSAVSGHIKFLDNVPLRDIWSPSLVQDVATVVKFRGQRESFAAWCLREFLPPPEAAAGLWEAVAANGTLVRQVDEKKRQEETEAFASSTCERKSGRRSSTSCANAIAKKSPSVLPPGRISRSSDVVVLKRPEEINSENKGNMIEARTEVSRLLRTSNPARPTARTQVSRLLRTARLLEGNMEETLRETSLNTWRQEVKRLASQEALQDENAVHGVANRRRTSANVSLSWIPDPGGDLLGRDQGYLNTRDTEVDLVAGPLPSSSVSISQANQAPHSDNRFSASSATSSASCPACAVVRGISQLRTSGRLGQLNPILEGILDEDELLATLETVVELQAAPPDLDVGEGQLPRRVSVVQQGATDDQQQQAMVNTPPRSPAEMDDDTATGLLCPAHAASLVGSATSSSPRLLGSQDAATDGALAPVTEAAPEIVVVDANRNNDEAVVLTPERRQSLRNSANLDAAIEHEQAMLHLAGRDSASGELQLATINDEWGADDDLSLTTSRRVFLISTVVEGGPAPASHEDATSAGDATELKQIYQKQQNERSEPSSASPFLGRSSWITKSFSGAGNDVGEGSSAQKYVSKSSTSHLDNVLSDFLYPGASLPSSRSPGMGTAFGASSSSFGISSFFTRNPTTGAASSSSSCSSSSSRRDQASSSTKTPDSDSSSSSSRLTPFELFALEETCREIDRLRAKFAWPKSSEKPKPPPGVPEILLRRPDSEERGRALNLFLKVFQQLGTKGAEFFQRGFTIKFSQDRGVDWGALTKAFANLMVEDVFRVDAALFLAVVPGHADVVVVRKEVGGGGGARRTARNTSSHDRGQREMDTSTGRAAIIPAEVPSPGNSQKSKERDALSPEALHIDCPAAIARRCSALEEPEEASTADATSTTASSSGSSCATSRSHSKSQAFEAASPPTVEDSSLTIGPADPTDRDGDIFLAESVADNLHKKVVPDYIPDEALLEAHEDVVSALQQQQHTAEAEQELATTNLAASSADMEELLGGGKFVTPDWALEILGRDPSYVRILYSFLGRFLAYCLYMRVRVTVRLSAYFYKCLLTPEIWLVFRRYSGGMQKPPKQEGRRKDLVKNNYRATTSSPTLADRDKEEKRRLTPQDYDNSKTATTPSASLLQYDPQLELDDACFVGGGPSWRSAAEAIRDLASVDRLKAKGLSELLAYEPASDVEHVFCLDFSLDFAFCGTKRRFLLKETSSTTSSSKGVIEGTQDEDQEDDPAPVTGENRNEYVMLVCKFLLKTSVRNSLSAFVLGFQSVVPQRCLRHLTAPLLESVLCGKSAISDQDILELKKKHLRITTFDGVPPTSAGMRELVDWFFDVILNDFDSEERTRLLIFWIGVAVVPAAGFGEIFPPITLSIASWCADSGVNNLHAPTRTSSSTELQHQSAESSAAGSSSSSSSSSSTNHQGRRRHVTSSSDKSALLRNESLPQSHVCFNRLDLPFYHSREQLSLKLRKAVQLCGNAVSIE
ncbi:unnamed protein product [Amoebophrya sp. A25]|nr:unnamed protein product [Amoebophrya sp. A25]|eukprot:GSA25T00008265001.1